MDKTTLKEIVTEQEQQFNKQFRIVKRQIPQTFLTTKKISVISGIRRCGKSTLLRQIARETHGYHYINFEDERLLQFNATHFNLLLEVFYERNPDASTFFFDEIQNIPGWEKFVSRLFSMDKKLFVTGSNARLLSSEISTSLTGRNLTFELYPFSFREYLDFQSFPLKNEYTTREKATISSHLENYLKYGGFPEIAESKNTEELIQLYRDILIKDLLVRMNIRDNKDFRELALYLLSNSSKKISFNNLKNMLHFSSTSKVKDYIDAMLGAYLFIQLFKYDPSIKKQIINDRKIYCIDTGLIRANAFSYSREEGRILENTVLLELKRRNLDIFYHQDKNECDFLIREGTKIKSAIQVSLSLHNPSTRNREIQGLTSTIEKYNLPSGTIITKSEEEYINHKNKKIYITPLWKFLLPQTPQ